MTNLLRRALAKPQTRSIATLEDYAQAVSGFVFGGTTYGFGGVQQTFNGAPVEKIPSDFTAYAQRAFGANGPVFACMMVRQLVFSAIRFSFQQLRNGKPSGLFGLPALRLVEEPWPGGTTQDLLSRMIQDADLAGNSYWTRMGDQLVRLRPDWTSIVLSPRIQMQPDGRRAVVGYERIGYVYTEGGYGAGGDPAVFTANEVAHFAPIPDPLATYRGMSWLTPVIRELNSDGAMSDYKVRYIGNAATPNMVVKVDPSVSPEMFERFREKMEAAHAGPENAGKTMYLGGGADVTVVGSNFKDLDLKLVQGATETRIAAAAGVPPVIVGLSEGLQAATYSNYAQARRRFADGTMHPLWQNAAGSLAPLLGTPPGARCWYDASDVPFLREDRRDAAEIKATQGQTIRTLIDAGYKPETVVAAVEAEDFTLLKHTGLFSVQLQPPGSGRPALPAGTQSQEAP